MDTYVENIDVKDIRTAFSFLAAYIKTRQSPSGTTLCIADSYPDLSGYEIAMAFVSNLTCSEWSHQPITTRLFGTSPNVFESWSDRDDHAMPRLISSVKDRPHVLTKTTEINGSDFIYNHEQETVWVPTHPAREGLIRLFHGFHDLASITPSVIEKATNIRTYDLAIGLASSDVTLEHRKVLNAAYSDFQKIMKETASLRERNSGDIWKKTECYFSDKVSLEELSTFLIERKKDYAATTRAIDARKLDCQKIISNLESTKDIGANFRKLTIIAAPSLVEEPAFATLRKNIRGLTVVKDALTS